MRLVLLTNVGPEHCYVAQVLADAFPADLAAIIIAAAPRRSLSSRVRSYRRRYSTRQIISRIGSKLYARAVGRSAHHEAAARTVLFPGSAGWVLPRQDLLRVFPSHNGPECLRALEELRPDIIAVYGTGVIRQGVMGMAGRGIVNLHTGISPRYRGSDTVFWALHNQEPEWIGATAHSLSEGLDAGSILATCRTPVSRDDDEATLFFKTVKVGATMYADAIKQLAVGTARPVEQDLSQGREYRFADRTVAAELRVRKTLARGLLSRFGMEAP
ncbi:MAG: formyl transferase [Acidiferrobacterales bacterium]